MDALRFHAILGRENLDVTPDQSRIFRIPHHAVADTDTDTEFEAIADDRLQGTNLAPRTWRSSTRSFPFVDFLKSGILGCVPPG